MSPARPRAANGHLVFDDIAADNVVITGDCVKEMHALPAASVDMVFTDPPYLCGYRDRAGRTVANDNRNDWLAPAFAEIHRVMKPGTLCISFYGWTATDAFFAAWRGAGLTPVGHIVFVKPYVSRRGLLKSMHESAYVLARGRPEFPVKPLSDVHGWLYTGNELHPTQKPVEVMKPLIRTYCREGGLVLDPFAGSGSILKAARECGRRFVGMELDPEHAATARRRLRC